jgi:hypothetical protein
VGFGGPPHDIDPATRRAQSGAMLRPHLIALSTLPLLLSGCLLETEACGVNFVSEDGRCVPAVDPMPYRGGSGATDGSLDASAFPDASVQVDAATSADGGLIYTHVLVVDRTPFDEVRNTPASPGADIDAVAVVPADGDAYYAARVAGAQVSDPFRISRWTDPAGALGPPDAPGFGEPGLLVCLGGEGGFVLLDLNLGRGLLPSDVIEVFELPGDPASDAYDVYACPEPPTSADACLLLGRGATTSRFSLP